MFNLALWIYVGLALAIFGSLAAVWGPGVKDPIIRTINTEVASVGVSLILLLILFRAIARLEEIGADV